jgi:membrane associated rhomboid family serine protease
MIPLRDNVPTRSSPVVTWALIFISVWVFFHELVLGPELEAFIQTRGFVPARHFLMAELDPSSWLGRYVPLVTSMFLHGRWMHLIGKARGSGVPLRAAGRGDPRRPRGAGGLPHPLRRDPP